MVEVTETHHVSYIMQSANANNQQSVTTQSIMDVIHRGCQICPTVKLIPRNSTLSAFQSDSLNTGVWMLN